MTVRKLLGLAAVAWVATAAPAHAYLDPGTGSIIAQAVIGAVVAAGVFWRAWWHRVTTFFRRGKTDEDSPATEPAADTKSGNP